MKHFYLKQILLCLCLFIDIKAFAYDAYVGGIYYDFSGNEATVTCKKKDGRNSISNYSGTVVIPKSVTYNGKNYSVTTIGDYAFYECSGLTSIKIPESVTYIGRCTFGDCSGLTSLIIPESVTSIGISAFYGCSGLTSLKIPENLTSITSGAFNYCSGLTSLIIPEGVVLIGAVAFFKCSSLKSVTIPSTVTDIENLAFDGCNNLTLVRTKQALPIDIYSNSFSNLENALLLVPTGSKDFYKNASYWKDFKKIVEYTEGDVNLDEEVDVVDVVDIARFVVGRPSASFFEHLADINNDNSVNIGDAVALVNNIAGDQNFVKAWAVPNDFTASDVLGLTKLNGCLSMSLGNERNYTAFQFDLYVPEDADVTQMMLNAKRQQGHQLIYNKVDACHYRVVALSTSNYGFNGKDGELLNIALEGISNGELRFRNIHFFDVNGRDYMFDDMKFDNTTGIESIPQPQSQSFSEDRVEQEGDNAIYDLQGRRLGRIQHGINVIGGKKVFVK